MARTALEAFKERVMMLGNRFYRPVRRRIEQSFPATDEIEVQLNTGSLRVLAAPSASVIRVTADIRSRDAHVANQMAVESHVEGNRTGIYFAGPFMDNHRTRASIDATIVVPRGARISVRNSLGSASIIGAGSTCEVHCSLGTAEVVLAPTWNGDKISAHSDIGKVKLSVPKTVPLSLFTASPVGKTRLYVESHEGAKPAYLRCGVGNVIVRGF